ncbi:MAG TPA: tetratricopeptide repeat protein, partial [Anaerolineales bacterium]|nr:tetratricopeptide repeat protein [Anaerolineales bacterium]
GMPLAIELAAAWVRVLSCREIAQEIEHSLDFLSGSARGLPARHRSMRAVFDHSWKLLTEEEQSIVCRLSIFQGGFQREAAEQVTGASLLVLSALLTKSLVYRSSEGRYDLHELIRQYALEKLVDQPRVHKETVARHGVYYMKYLAKEDERLRGTTQREALTELTAEIENIRRAQDWALINHKFTLIEGAMRAYLVFYDALGWAKEALDTLGRIINTLESIREKSPLSETEELALAHTLSARSLFAFRVSQHEKARAMLDQSLEILRRLNEPRVLVEALTFLGIVTTIMGDPARASELFKEGLQTATAIGDHWFSALCLTELVGTTVMIGKAENAHEQFQSAVAAWRTTGDLRFTAFGLNFLSLSAVAVGKYEEARGALKESIAISTSIGDRWSLGNSYRGLGLIAQAQGEHSQALDAFHKSCDIFDELGARWDIARVLSDMGRSIFALGNDSEAAHTWREAIRIATETQGMLVVQDAMVGFAGLHAKHGNAKYALELLLVVLHHPATVQETKNRASLLRPGVQAQLTPEEIQSAQRLAESKKFESLVEAILDQAWKG